MFMVNLAKPLTVQVKKKSNNWLNKAEVTVVVVAVAVAEAAHLR